MENVSNLDKKYPMKETEMYQISNSLEPKSSYILKFSLLACYTLCNMKKKYYSKSGHFMSTIK